MTVIQLRKMEQEQIGTIRKVTGSGEVGRRIRDMGIIAGVKIKVIGKAPLFDPVAIKVRDTIVTLRNNEADHIYVEVG